MPEAIRKAIPVGIGLFIAFIGMQNAKIISDNPYTLVQFVDLTQIFSGSLYDADGNLYNYTYLFKKVCNFFYMLLKLFMF